MTALGQISTFLDALAAERDASRNTQLAYGRDLKDYVAWLAARKLTPERAGKADIERYLAHVADQGLSSATRARRLSTLRQFYRFAFEEGWRKDDPAIRLTGPDKEKRLPQTLTETEVARLVEAARKGGRHADRTRNTCLVELLYATGLRVSELVSLPVAAVQGDPQMILVKGKGGKERMVPLSPPARTAITAWLADRAASVDPKSPSRFLFPSRGASGHLTRNRFYLLVKELAVTAGIDPSKVTPHTLRHAFATHLLANGADLRSIQMLLGHADLSTTEIYTHVLDERLKSLVLTHHPLAD